MGQNGNGSGGAAPFGGREFTLPGGRTVAIPEFSLDEIEAYLDAMEEIAAARTSARASVQAQRKALGVVFRAVTRNHPDLTYEDFATGIGFLTIGPLFDMVREANGLQLVPVPEDPPLPTEPAA